MSKTHLRRLERSQAGLPDLDDLRPIREVEALTGVPARTLRRWAQESRIRASKPFGGRLWYVHPDDAAKLSRALRPGPKPDAK